MIIPNREEYNSILSRLVNIDQEKKGLGEDFNGILLEAKSKEYDPKALRRVVRDMRKDPSKLREENDAYELYAHAAGILSLE